MIDTHIRLTYTEARALFDLASATEDRDKAETKALQTLGKKLDMQTKRLRRQAGHIHEEIARRELSPPALAARMEELGRVEGMLGGAGG